MEAAASIGVPSTEECAADMSAFASRQRDERRTYSQHTHRRVPVA
ncbi:hypothetical protein [Acuticoccus sp.]